MSDQLQEEEVINEQTEDNPNHDYGARPRRVKQSGRALS